MPIREDGCIIAMPVINVGPRTVARIRVKQGVPEIAIKERGQLSARVNRLFHGGWLPDRGEWNGQYCTLSP